MQLLRNLIALNSALFDRVRASKRYDEALAYYTAREYQKAFLFMSEAAQFGSLDAMSLLGSMYLLGQGVPEDGRQAEAWLKRAVDGGYEGAVPVLGMAYATGKAGIPVNLNLAREMLTVAAANGDQQSARMLEMMANGEGMFRKQKQGRSRK